MSEREWILIGWDVAVSPANNALVRAVAHPAETGGSIELTITDVVRPHDTGDIRGLVETWVGESGGPVMLCVDAPLGWPQSLAPALAGHRAGRSVGSDPEHLFRRDTDRDIRKRLGKTPLDVGADRIARTAWAALETIDSLSDDACKPVLPLDYDWLKLSGNNEAPLLLLFETYPAAWFASERIVTSGYRPPAGRARRRQLLQEVEAAARSGGIDLRLNMGVGREDLSARADDLDALICTLIGVDLLLERCPAPQDQRVAHIEGWIWCKNRV